jgi:predicted Zn-dependent protease
VLLICALLGACGSSSSTASSAEVKRTCKQVEAVLSDGPEPAADPVGYAQAQILPLRQIRTSDGKLQEAIHRLAAAYQAFSADNRIQHAANSAVTAAVHGVNALCPGAAS